MFVSSIKSFFRTGGEEGLSEPLVACSLSRFLSQFLFGYWIGFVYGLAAMLSFTKSRPTLHSILVGAAVCKGFFFSFMRIE